jgi:hypothetical protein
MPLIAGQKSPTYHWPTLNVGVGFSVEKKGKQAVSPVVSSIEDKRKQVRLAMVPRLLGYKIHQI